MDTLEQKPPSEIIRCPHCGGENVSWGTFCGECGEKMSQSNLENPKAKKEKQKEPEKDVPIPRKTNIVFGPSNEEKNEQEKIENKLREIRTLRTKITDMAQALSSYSDINLRKESKESNLLKVSGVLPEFFKKIETIIDDAIQFSNDNQELPNDTRKIKLELENSSIDEWKDDQSLEDFLKKIKISNLQKTKLDEIISECAHKTKELEDQINIPELQELYSDPGFVEYVKKHSTTSTPKLGSITLWANMYLNRREHQEETKLKEFRL